MEVRADCTNLPSCGVSASDQGTGAERGKGDEERTLVGQAAAGCAQSTLFE